MKKTLKEMREAKGIKKYAAAAAVPCSAPTYAKLEKDPTLMTIRQLDNVCAFMGCSRNDIFLPTNYR